MYRSEDHFELPQQRFRTHVEDGRRPAELAPGELERLVHAKDLSSAHMVSSEGEKNGNDARESEGKGGAPWHS